MARREITQYFDDIDGTPLTDDQVNTVRFSVDGSDYVIDLSEDNATRFLELLAPTSRPPALPQWPVGRVPGLRVGRSVRIPVGSASGRRPRTSRSLIGVLSPSTSLRPTTKPTPLRSLAMTFCP